jgi:hypothetical protein
MCSSIETHNHDENKAIELAAVKMIHKPASQLFQPSSWPPFCPNNTLYLQKVFGFVVVLARFRNALEQP